MEAQSRSRRLHRKFFFFLAPVSAFGGAGQQGQAGGNGDRMMWIWYLLLGSGSGSRTVGEYLKQAETKVSVFFCHGADPLRSTVVLGEGGHVKFLKCGGCAASFSLPLLDEFKLVGTQYGRAHFTSHLHRVGAYFLATNRKLREPSFFSFFLSLSNPFLMEHVPFTPQCFNRIDVHTPPHLSAGAAVRMRFDSLPG